MTHSEEEKGQTYLTHCKTIKLEFGYLLKKNIAVDILKASIGTKSSTNPTKKP